MNIPLKGGLTRSPLDVAQDMQKLATAVSAGWRVEHQPDGTHKTPWKVVEFASTQYATSGAMTWTVGAGNVLVNKWYVQGTTMHWSLWLGSTIIGGTPDAYLYVTIPDSYRGPTATGTQTTIGPTALYLGAASAGVWVVEGRRVRFSPDPVLNNWTAGTLSLAANMTFEVVR